jgi:hypothetical protein
VSTSDAPHSFALEVQLLPNANDQTLALAYVLQSRGSGPFTPAEIRTLFRALRVPEPANVSTVFARLRQRSLLVSHSGLWQLTPLGEREARALLKSVDLAHVERLLRHTDSGPLLAEVRQLTIPPEFAPPRWLAGIRRLLDRHPFDRNVFCMTRFPTESLHDDALRKALETARHAFSARGFMLHVASDRAIDDNVLGNVGAYMWACQYGVGFLEKLLPDRAELNYNVIMEAGSMIMTGRRCLLLRDASLGTTSLPTDLVGEIYASVDVSRPQTIIDAIDNWVATI